MRYTHKDAQQNLIDLPVGKIVCVGRNYAEHAKELGNAVPKSPLLFMKPASTLVSLIDGGKTTFPKDKGSCHFETEIAILIKDTITASTTVTDITEAIWGYGLALDLTLRDLQSELKAKGHPWEKAKCFDGACPITGFLAAKALPNAPENITYQLDYNHKPQQFGNTQDMITPIIKLLQYMAEHFTLYSGDIVLTGTPSGVGQLASGDLLVLSLEDTLSVSTTFL